jgi:hypothetical protein
MARLSRDIRRYLLTPRLLAPLLALASLIVLGQTAVSSAQSKDQNGFSGDATQVAPNPKVVLASGPTGRLEWTMLGLRLPGRSAHEPCIRVASSVKGSGGYLQGQTSCGSVASTRALPLGSISSSRRTHTSILGLAFGLNVRKLRLEKNNGSVRRMTPLRLDREKEKVLGLRPFAYVAIVSRSDPCYRSIVGLSRKDAKIFELRRESCP